MMLEAAFLLVSALATTEPPSGSYWPPPLAKLFTAPAYNPPERAVGNWRVESALSLDLAPMSALRLAAGGDLASTPRCVKLNNYWCVKRGGWVGEIAADGEGHVAFASADDGAAVAALLLRRYYIDYKRRSARAIVARWAPARCLPIPEPFPAPNLALTSDPPPLRPASLKPESKPTPRKQPDTVRAAAAAVKAKNPAPSSKPPAPLPQRAEQAVSGIRRMMPQRVVSMGLAPMGLENTLRARWLATHGRGGIASPPKTVEAKAEPRRSFAAVDRSPMQLTPAPAIAAGMGEPARKAQTAPPSLAPAPPPTAKPADSPPRPVEACIGERERLANYAARVISGVVAGPDDDLVLFSADGAPTDNLAKVMANMAAVEIGPLRASNSLIAAGIAQMNRLLAKATPSKPVAPLADNAPLPPPRP